MIYNTGMGCGSYRKVEGGGYSYLMYVDSFGPKDGVPRDVVERCPKVVFGYVERGRYSEMNGAALRKVIKASVEAHAQCWSDLPRWVYIKSQGSPDKTAQWRRVLLTTLQKHYRKFEQVRLENGDVGYLAFL